VRHIHIEVVHVCLPPAEENVCDEHGKATTPATVEDYMGYTDKSDIMANKYSVSQRMWKWEKNIFNQLDLIIMNNYYHYRTTCNFLYRHTL
jgi:hypothetical protein